MQMILFARLALVSALALAAAGAQANLLANGSFENGSFVDNGEGAMSLNPGSAVITDWTVVTDTTAWITNANAFQLSASEGNYFLDLTDYPGGAPFADVEQTVATVAGVSYRLSFDLGSSDLYGRPAAVTASAGGRSETFTSPLSGGDDDWQTVTMEFTAVASSTVVTLQGQTGAFYIGLDNAVLTAVPEPATGVLALAGLAAVAGMVRRRRLP